MANDRLFKALRKGIQEGIEHQKGKMDLRTTSIVIPKAPPKKSKRQIKHLREDKLGVSQPIFAKMLGVSAAAVKAWEQGVSKPSGTALRVMQVCEKDPETFLNSLVD